MLPGRELTIDSILKILLRRRWLIVGPLFLGVLGGLLYSRSQPSLYRSDAVIQVVPQRVPESYVSATVTERVEDRLRALAQQVLSRTQLEKLITEFNLFPDERQRYPLEDVIQLMMERVLIVPLALAQTSRRDSQSEAFRVSFDYGDAAVAQKVVERLASFFIDTNARERGTQAEQTSAFLEAQMADARSRLEAQEKRLKDFRERNSGRLPTQTPTNMQAVQNLQMQIQALVESLARDRDRRLINERLLSDARAEEQAAPAAPVITIPMQGGATPVGATTATQLDLARAELSALELKYTPDHPDIGRQRRTIAELEKKLAAEALQAPVSPGAPGTRPSTREEEARRNRVRLLETEKDSLDRQIAFKEGEEKRLRGLVADYQARLEAVPGIESQWIALTRDYDTLQETYRALLSKSENSKMAASLEQRQIGEQFRLLDPPRVPLKPHSPNRRRISALGTLAGLGLGLLLVGLVEYRDSTMRSEADVLGAIDLPVLVVLPYVTAEADQRLQRRRRRVVSAAAVVASVATGALFWFLQLWKFVV